MHQAGAQRIVEAYIGEYASGKSEVAVNRALELKDEDRAVTLVDLDLVEPFFTLRPIKAQLESMGLRVIAWETRGTMGLGEAGSILKPEMRWALNYDGDVIFDVGYGVSGAKVFNLLQGVESEKHFQTIAVVNASRPATGTVQDIVEYVTSLGEVNAIINNTHLGDETDVETVQAGAKTVSQAARQLGLPVLATTAIESISLKIGQFDAAGNPVKTIHRYMTQSFW